MHWGGDSTLTREGSLNVVTRYMNSDIGASSLNWSGHKVEMIWDLNHLIRRELNVDHNNMVYLASKGFKFRQHLSKNYVWFLNY
jgi:hypothetical protein